MCTVELTRDLPTSENGSGDVLGTSRHAQEMLELALKPGSASSRSSSNIGSASSQQCTFQNPADMMEVVLLVPFYTMFYNLKK
jgi:hypothetical protein